MPGRTYAIPIPVTAGETISIATKSRDFWDSIAVLLAADGSRVVGSDRPLNCPPMTVAKV